MSKTNMGAFTAVATFLNAELQDALKNLASDARQAWRAMEIMDRLRELGAPIENEADLDSQVRRQMKKNSAGVA